MTWIYAGGDSRRGGMGRGDYLAGTKDPLALDPSPRSHSATEGACITPRRRRPGEWGSVSRSAKATTRPNPQRRPIRVSNKRKRRDGHHPFALPTAGGDSLTGVRVDAFDLARTSPHLGCTDLEVRCGAKA